MSKLIESGTDKGTQTELHRRPAKTVIKVSIKVSKKFKFSELKLNRYNAESKITDDHIPIEYLSIQIGSRWIPLSESNVTQAAKIIQTNLEKIEADKKAKQQVLEYEKKRNRKNK